MFAAATKENLLHILLQSDITVPPRNEGRTKHHTERYCLYRLLATFAGTNLIRYPTKVFHGDRPDFTLESPDWIVGVEHTEAVPENKAHSDRLRAQHASNKSFFLSRHTPGEKPKKAKKLIGEIEANNAGYGWPGNSAEREWAQVIDYFIDKKIAAISNSDFVKHCENWLLIYDNWPLPSLDIELATDYLMDRSAIKLEQSKWDVLFIMRSKYIIEISTNNLKSHSINDIWEQ